VSLVGLDGLNDAFGIDGVLRFDAGPGGLTRGVVQSSACEAEFYLHGAQVTRWRPAGHGEVLWLSPTAKFEGGRAIRGGIPVCFPWFGAHPDNGSAPSHGLARIRPWDLRGTRRIGDVVEVDLGTYIAPWECRLTASFGETLTVALEIRNAGDENAAFEAALHTYLAVSDVEAVALSGLERAPFIDMAAGRVRQNAEGAPLHLRGEVDRLYPNRSGLVTVHDESRLIEVDGGGARSTVVWNPGQERAARLADLGEGWRQMVCVETANVAGDRVMLPRDGTWRMSTTIRPVSPKQATS